MITWEQILSMNHLLLMIFRGHLFIIWCHSVIGMRCKMLELLQTQWWKTSSLCLLAFSWAKERAFPLKLKQALTLLYISSCGLSLSGLHSSMEKNLNNLILLILLEITISNSYLGPDKVSFIYNSRGVIGEI